MLFQHYNILGLFTEDDFDTGGGTILVDTTIVGLKVFREDLLYLVKIEFIN